MNTNSPVYGDCPACGKACNLSAVNPEALVVCQNCECKNYAKWWLNLRHTPQRVDSRGWLGRLFLGSGLQKSAAEQRAEERAEIVRRIESLRTAVRFAKYNQDFQRAMFHQTELERAEQELEDFDNDE